MDIEETDKEKEKQLLRQTFKHVNSCLILSGISPRVIQSDEETKPRVFRLPKASDEEKKLLVWAETSTLSLISERLVDDLLLSSADSDENNENCWESVRSDLSYLNMLITRRDKDASLNAFYQRFETSSRLNYTRGMQTNARMLDMMSSHSIMQDMLASLPLFGNILNPCKQRRGPRSAALTFPARSTLPQFAAVLKMKDSKLVTTEHLRTGDVIAIEEADCCTIPDTSRYERCDWCLKDDPLCMMPCEGCRFVMYCSLECQTKALISYHSMECKVTNVLNPTAGPEIWMISPLRNVCKALGLFRNDLRSLRVFFETLRKKNFVPLFNRDFSNMNDMEKFAAKMGKPFDGPIFPTNSPFASSSRTVASAIAKCLPKGKQTAEDTQFLQSFVEWNLKRSTECIFANDIMLYENNEGTITTEPKTVSYGWYPLLQLFESSCNPNVIFIDVEPKKKAAIVLRIVKKGQQLTVRHLGLINKSHSIATPEDHCSCVMCKCASTDDPPCTFNPTTVIWDDLLLRESEVSKWGYITPPYEKLFFQDLVAYLACLRAYYMEHRKQVP